MNLYDVYQNAVDNNDGNIIDKLTIAGKDYPIETQCHKDIYEVIICVDDTKQNDLTIVLYNVNGDIIFKNTNPYYYHMLLKVNARQKICNLI